MTDIVGLPPIDSVGLTMVSIASVVVHWALKECSLEKVVSAANSGSARPQKFADGQWPSPCI